MQLQGHQNRSQPGTRIYIWRGAEKYESCLKAWKWRSNGEESRVKCIEYGRKNTVVGEKMCQKE